MEMGSVRKILDSHFPEGIPESAASPIIRDILLGLVHLHERGIVHRALKVNNKCYLSRIRNKRSTTFINFRITFQRLCRGVARGGRQITAS